MRFLEPPWQEEYASAVASEHILQSHSTMGESQPYISQKAMAKKCERWWLKSQPPLSSANVRLLQRKLIFLSERKVTRLGDGMKRNGNTVPEAQR